MRVFEHARVCRQNFMNGSQCALYIRAIGNPDAKVKLADIPAVVENFADDFLQFRNNDARFCRSAEAMVEKSSMLVTTSR